MPSEGDRNVVVLGAGVIGLSIAFVLSEDVRNKITIVARDMPEHYDSQGWSSPWAGANWSPIGTFTERTLKWESITFKRLWSMIPTGLVMELPSKLYGDKARDLDDLWWKDIVQDFKVIPEDQLPEGVDFGLSYTTVSTKPARYLRWMKGELEKRNVRFVSRNVGSLEDVSEVQGNEAIVINATGLGSRSLLGVEDQDVYPIRGQTIIVNAPHVKTSTLDVSVEKKEPGESTYIIPRPDGSVILGGTFQHDDWELAINHRTARGIYERCSSMEPGLLPSKGTTILSHNVGLRPARRGGPRVEIEIVKLPLASDLVPCSDTEHRPKRDMKVIHAYGFGPAGYQNSWGVAVEVASLLELLLP